MEVILKNMTSMQSRNVTLKKGLWEKGGGLVKLMQRIVRDLSADTSAISWAETAIRSINGCNSESRPCIRTRAKKLKRSSSKRIGDLNNFGVVKSK